MKKGLCVWLAIYMNAFSSFGADLPFNFSQTIKRFQQNQGEWITSHCQYLQMGKVHYYGIRSDEQMQKKDSLKESILATRALYQEMKRRVLQSMSLPIETEVVQVVGDCTSYSLQGTLFVKEFLRTYLPNDCIILFGYTGRKGADGTRCVNGAVSDIIEERGLLDRSIGNLVAFHTRMALEKWGYVGPDLTHYVIVYRNRESLDDGAAFGEDITSSDFFADRLLVIEGGVQSFRQICNALLLEQRIDLVYGIRFEKAQFIDAQGIQTPYFSAAKFILDAADFTAKKKDAIEADLQQWYREYFGQGKCYLADPQKPEFEIKQKKLDEAWAFFVQERLDRHALQLITVH